MGFFKRNYQKTRLRLGLSALPHEWRELYCRAEQAAGTPEEHAAFAAIERQRGLLTRELAKPSRDAHWGRFLFQIIRKTRPSYCVELGTCAGISAAYMGVGLQMCGAGKLVTIDHDPERVAVARRNFDALGLTNIETVTGTFADELPAVLARERPGLVFVDGHHDGAATLEYFKMIRTRMASGGVIVFDDIHWSRDMARAWRQIRRQVEAYDLGFMGFCPAVN